MPNTFVRQIRNFVFNMADNVETVTLMAFNTNSSYCKIGDDVTVVGFKRFFICFWS